jgi:hypothetical protein
MKSPNVGVQPVNQPRPAVIPTPPATPKEVTLYRLNQESLAALRKGNRVGVNSNTTELQAGFLLGVQHILQVLEEGFTV